MSRDELLRVASDGENDQFLELIQQHERKDNDINLRETVESLSNKQLDELWTSLNQKSTITLLSFSAGDDEQGQEELKTAGKVLQGIIMIAMATIQQKEVAIPLPLLETAVVLHGILPSIPEDMNKLHTNIARMCEFWWTHKLEGRESVAVNTISYHLEKSLLPNVSAADIKRVWSLRECLHQVQLDNESSETLKTLLKETMTSTKYLKNEEGRKFLSFLFSLSPNFIESLHMTIKNQIPYCSSSLLPLYGEIYFRAWRVSADISLEKIETKCLQDLMYRAIHAMRGNSNSMASRLKKLLSYIHKQKKQKGVDQMLLKLYEPFLWRSLKVANGLVRANAVGILVDVFPLLDPDASNEEMDALLQKQFDILLTLLEDPVVVVRASTVQGVCHILTVYWELIPKAMIQTFLLKLLQDLAWDSASADVRTSVLTGLAHLLDNHLSHQMLKNVLPEMKNLLHDNSEMVRIAFMEILIRIKRIKTIKYWAVAPMEHLLARLELDDAPVCKRIVSLIFNSFIPADKPPEVQLDRVVHLIQTNRGGARKFFKYAQVHMSPSSIAKFMILLCRYVLQCVRKEVSQMDEERSVSSQDEADEEKENEGDDDSNVSARDTVLMAGMLEAIIILWEGSGKIFMGSDNELKQNLDMKFSRALPELFRYFQDEEVCACLILLAGFLPANTIPTFSRSLLSKLKGMSMDNSPEQYGSLIESMCKWHKTRDLLELIADWLEATIVVKDPNESNKSINRSKSKGVRFDAPVEAKPQLGLAYLKYLTTHAVCRETVLQQNRDELVTILDLLGKVTKCVENRLRLGEAADEGLTDDLLVELLEEYLRLQVLLHNPNSDEDATKMMESILKWSTQNLLPLLKQRRQHKRRLLTQSETTLSSQDNTLTMMGDVTAPTLSTTLLSTTLKRGAGDAVDYGKTDLAAELIKRVLCVASDMCLVGIGNYGLATQLADFTVNLLSTEDSVRLLSEVASLMYHITEFMLSRQRRKDPFQNVPQPDTDSQSEPRPEEEVSHSDMVPDMLKKVLSMVAHLVRVKKELAERVLPTLKPAMSEMLFSYYHHQSLNQTLCKDVMAAIMASVVAEMTSVIKKDNFLEKKDGISSLPLLSAFILGIITKRGFIASIFLDELCQCVNSGAVETIEGILGILHMLYTLSKTKSTKNNLKECMTSLQTQFEALETPDIAADESPYRYLYQSTKTMLKDVMTDAGMVA